MCIRDRYKDCTCPPLEKIPLKELEFYATQCITGKGKIQSAVDVSTSKKYDNLKAKELEKQRISDRLDMKKQRESFKNEVIDSSSKALVDILGYESSSDSSNEPEQQKSVTYNKHDYRPFISVMRRYNVPERAIASGINAMNLSYGITEPSMYVSRKKVSGMIKKYGQELIEKHSQLKGFKCLSFDGKKCDILQAPATKSDTQN